jgi:phosphoglucosamine mutase
MTPETALAVGRAVAAFFADGGPAKVVIGKDTRLSGDMLAHAMTAGILSAGGTALIAGILPTPGVAFLAADAGADAGIVLSASHNPFYDNGIKIFDGKGFKLPDAVEDRLEALILKEASGEGEAETGRAHWLEDADDRYIGFLKGRLAAIGDLKGMKIVLDCANGATYRVAPRLFTELGAGIVPLSVDPDGKNINDNCGSEHTDSLVAAVRETGAQLGLAFDGDGDRLIASDEMGNVLTGDQILALCARRMKEKGTLRNNTVVSTVMSNIGLGLALKDLSIDHVMANVGDRYVAEKMTETGAVIGGEDSGHMIFSHHHTTGDGLLTALMLIDAMIASDRPLSEMRKIMSVFPQSLMNLEVTEKPDLRKVPGVAEEIRAVEEKLGEKGRVLVRYSGTQPLCRVMVEGPTVEETEGYCRHLVGVIRDAIG